MITQQDHLSSEQKQKLFKVLKKHKKPFQGTVRVWDSLEVEIEMKQNADPYHGKAYRILHSIRPVLQKKVDRFVEIGVLSPNKDSK